MPGDNCAVFGCGTCRLYERNRYLEGSSSVGCITHKKWRADWLRQITKTREIDQDLRERIKNERVFTREKHFLPEDIEICKFRCFLLLNELLSSLFCHVCQLYLIFSHSF